jgi:DnaT-like ssDNA binding protein
MPVTLVVENGDGVPTANSYDTVANAVAYAANRGIVLPDTSDDGQTAAWLVSGTDFIESFSQRFVGQRASWTQGLSWPRKCVMWNPDTPFPDDEIPVNLISALDQCVIAQFQGIVLQPSISHAQGGYVTESKVGPIITKFSEKIGTTTPPLLPSVMNLLNTLLIPIATLPLVRI